MDSALSEWTEIDEVLHRVGHALGLVSEGWQQARSVIEVDGPVNRGLTKAVLALVAEGVLEANFIVEEGGAWCGLEEGPDDFAFRRLLPSG